MQVIPPGTEAGVVRVANRPTLIITPTAPYTGAVAGGDRPREVVNPVEPLEGGALVWSPPLQTLQNAVVTARRS